MQESNIAWTDYTWNPVHGCSKVSAGCENCYAERISRQYGHTEQPWDREHAEKNVTERPDKLEEPYSLGEPSRVFVNSMSDLFHSQVSEEFIRDVFAVMRNCPEHVFQILTKRPGRAAHMTLEWPPNVWMGTSVEDGRVTERLDLLRSCDADTLFVSFEPLIGPVGDVDLSGFDWAIVGGESGADDVRREMDHEWARDLLHQCRRDDVAFFFKQSSGRQPETGTALTVDRGGVFVQVEIREVSEPHPAVRRARGRSRMPTDTSNDGQGTELTTTDLPERVYVALDRRLTRNYGDTIGGITSVVVGDDLDTPARKVSRVLARMADRDEADLSPGDLRVERDRNAGKNLQHWRVTRVKGGDSDGE